MAFERWLFIFPALSPSPEIKFTFADFIVIPLTMISDPASGDDSYAQCETPPSYLRPPIDPSQPSSSSHLLHNNENMHYGTSGPACSANTNASGDNRSSDEENVYRGLQPIPRERYYNNDCSACLCLIIWIWIILIVIHFLGPLSQWLYEVFWILGQKVLGWLKK